MRSAIAAVTVLLLSACPAPSGTVGPQGPEGQPGAAGATGPTGPQGSLGPQGPKGDQGDLGSMGTQGPAGPQGVQGPAGQVLVIDGGVVVGPPGSSVVVTPVTAGGMPCPTGGIRVTQLSDGGITHLCHGAVGPQGPTGSQGVAGPIGVAGPMGVQGPVGLQGASVSTSVLPSLSPQCVTGGLLLTFPDAGTAAVCNGAQGVAGAQGSPGAQGLQGLAGAQGSPGAQGPIGLTGAAGAQGAVGPQGLAGAAGPQGVAGAQGPAGPPGQVLFLDGGVATQDWAQFAGFTTATYTGDLGGIPGANAKCDAEFPGSFFCTTADYFRAEPGAGAPAGGAWVDFNRDVDGDRSTGACYATGAWTNGTTTDSAYSFNTTGDWSTYACNTPRALTCCRGPTRGVFRGFTAATYTGNLGGIPGANAKCRSEFPGSFFCTTADYFRAEPRVGAPASGAWVDFNRDTDGDRSTGACYATGAWTNGTTSDSAYSFNTTGDWSTYNCSGLRSLSCCQAW